MPDLLTTSQAAQRLAVSERQLWAQTQPRGPIPAVRIGKSVRYSQEALDAYIRGESPRPSQTTVEDVLTLHRHCVPAADIASTLHLPEVTVRHVIETGKLSESAPASR